jgi:hypothetical protein
VPLLASLVLAFVSTALTQTLLLLCVLILLPPLLRSFVQLFLRMEERGDALAQVIERLEGKAELFDLQQLQLIVNHLVSTREAASSDFAVRCMSCARTKEQQKSSSARGGPAAMGLAKTHGSRRPASAMRSTMRSPRLPVVDSMGAWGDTVEVNLEAMQRGGAARRY